MSDTLPTFSVVIPAYKRMDLLERSVSHLLAQEYPRDCYEVVVVDHEGGTASVVVECFLARDPSLPVRLVYCPSLTAMAKRNHGARVAYGEYVLFHNDDIWPDPRLLREHAQSHLLHAPDPVAVLGHVDQSLEMPFSPFVESYRPYAYQELADQGDRPVHWWYFYAPNISLPRQVMLAGEFFFREDWPELVHEDVELGYRWWRAGYKLVYNPRAQADHYHPHTLATAAQLQVSLGRHLPRLERLVDEPRLRERYGVFSWRNRPRAVVRGLLRRALFNEVTLPTVERWLDRQSRNTRLTRWLYWKVLLHYTNQGYRQGQALYAGRGS